MTPWLILDDDSVPQKTTIKGAGTIIRMFASMFPEKELYGRTFQETGEEDMLASFGVVNSHLKKKGPLSFLVGTRLTIADVSLLACLQMLPSRDFKQLADLSSWFARVSALAHASEVGEKQNNEALAPKRFASRAKLGLA
eukprot:GEMP01097464.1.p1 GENE.GEMP01097464.1~~GEMP01097464.1.p1  ORF type:complete len:140 (+),score=25.35 GEMP01097464.1:199-618(+)